MSTFKKLGDIVAQSIISGEQFEYYKGVAEDEERLIFSFKYLIQSGHKGVKFK